MRERGAYRDEGNWEYTKFLLLPFVGNTLIGLLKNADLLKGPNGRHQFNCQIICFTYFTDNCVMADVFSAA